MMGSWTLASGQGSWSCLSPTLRGTSKGQSHQSKFRVTAWPHILLKVGKSRRHRQMFYPIVELFQFIIWISTSLISFLHRSWAEGCIVAKLSKGWIPSMYADQEPLLTSKLPGRLQISVSRLLHLLPLLLSEYFCRSIRANSPGVIRPNRPGLHIGKGSLQAQ